MKKIILSLLIALPAAIAACTAINTASSMYNLLPDQLKPPVELPPQAIDKVGVWAFQTWTKTAKESKDAKSQALVNEVIEHIAAAARHTKYAKDAEQFKWEVRLIENSQPNAFGFPGGKIAVYTGLLDFTNGQKDWLAVAIGHEVVHSLARHAGERMNKGLKQTLVMATASGQLMQEGLNPAATAGVMAAMGVTWAGNDLAPFSRGQESEADHEGLLLMAQAGYNPGVAIRFHDEMGQRCPAGADKQGFMAMHPNFETRINQLQEWMPEAEKSFQMARREK